VIVSLIIIALLLAFELVCAFGVLVLSLCYISLSLRFCCLCYVHVYHNIIFTRNCDEKNSTTFIIVFWSVHSLLSVVIKMNWNSNSYYNLYVYITSMHLMKMSSPVQMCRNIVN